MLALTVMYCIVFFYIRSQLRKFSSETDLSSDQQSPAQELERWQADLEAGGANPDTPPRQIMTTRMVSVTTEDHGPSLTTESTNGLSISLRNTPTNQSHLIARKRMLQVARSLLWYPLIYLCVTAPLTMGRLAQFADDDWATTCIFVGASFYASGGWLNVLLYTTTRKGIISWTWCGRNRKPSRRHSKAGIPPFASSRTPHDKFASHSSTMTSGSNHSDDDFDRQIPPSSNDRRDSKENMLFEGVDFTHSTGFDIVDMTDDSKVGHDRYCLQNRLDAENLGIDTKTCTCKDIPKNK